MLGAKQLKRSAKRLPESKLKEYRIIFDAVDGDRSGAISFHELRSAFHENGIEVQEAELKAMVIEFDDDRSGNIDFYEFVACMEKLQEQASKNEKILQSNMLEMELEMLDLDLQKEEKRKLKENCLRVKIQRTLNDPDYSPQARMVSIAVLMLVLLSSVAFCVETLPSLHQRNEETWFIVELVCIACFSLEFGLRLATCDNLWSFMKSPLNIVDVAAILPFYLELGVDPGSNVGGSSAVLKVVRLARVFRLVKVSRYLTWFKVFSTSLRQSVAPLGVLFFVAIVATICFSAAIYFLERGDWDETSERFIGSDGEYSQFDSIPISMWFIFVTMTTVGYGDMTPVTGWGRVVAAITSFVGILIFAAPISVISANFQREYRRLTQVAAFKMEHKRLAEMGFQAENVYLDSLHAVLANSKKTLLADVRAIEQENRRELVNDIMKSLTFNKKSHTEEHHNLLGDHAGEEAGHHGG